MERIKIGLIGFGTVGRSLYQLLEQNGASFRERLGVGIEVARIGVRDITKKRDLAPADRFVEGYEEIVKDPEIPVIVELVGGIDVPARLIREALARGKHVITANKALLAQSGDELFRLALEKQVDLKFEASVCGGIPIIKVIRESLRGNRIRGITGIVNGTTNYILTRMGEEGMSFQDALAEAQRLGFAESDPTMDVEGIDAAQKISLLASVAFGDWVDYRQVLCEGIAAISPKEIEFARLSGFVFKLLAQARLIEGRPAVTVFPALIPQSHPLAAVRGEFNAVLLESDFLGPSMYSGRGAGGPPTASAVASDLGDVIERIIQRHLPDFIPPEPLRKVELYPVDELEYRYFLHFITENRPGIWATVTSLLAENGINIESVHQKWLDRTQPSDLFILIDPAREAQARRAFQAIVDAPGIFRASRFYRIL
jgi:homoserine dehydrogenase